MSVYSEHFEISKDPFRRLSGAKYFYPSNSQVEVCNDILDAISRRTGLILLTGPKGAGKTMTMMRIMGNLDAHTHAIRLQDENKLNNVFNRLYNYFKSKRLADFRHASGDGLNQEPATIKNVSHFNDNLRRVEVNELVHFVKHNLDEIQIDHARKLRVLRKSLEGESRHGRNAVVFIDNIKRIDPEILKELVRLSTARYSEEKLLQIVIAASDRQALELVRAFKNSIALIRRAKPLDAVEVEPYLCHLLSMSGFEGEAPFTPKAIQRITVRTKRIPRLINAICRGSIAIAEREFRDSITLDIVEKAASEGGGVKVRRNRGPSKAEIGRRSLRDSRQSRRAKERSDRQSRLLDGRWKSPLTPEPSFDSDKDRAKSRSQSTAKLSAPLAFVDTESDARQAKRKTLEAGFDITAALLDRGLKTFLLTATHGGAGNTACASALAHALRRFTDNKVLIVDGSRSGDSLSQRFGLEREPGLFNLLYDDGSMDVSRYVQTGNGAGFDLLTSGNDFPTDQPFLRSRVEGILQSLNNKYRYVIYDAPPIPTSPGLYAIASLFDGVALVVQAEKSRWEPSQVAVSQLQQSGAKMLGVIMNRRKYFIPKWLYENL